MTSMFCFYFRTPSGGELNIPRNRSSAGSRTSLMSMASASSGAWCRHRSAAKFDSLENLNLSHNQLTDLTFVTENVSVSCQGRVTITLYFVYHK